MPPHWSSAHASITREGWFLDYLHVCPLEEVHGRQELGTGTALDVQVPSAHTAGSPGPWTLQRLAFAQSGSCFSTSGLLPRSVLLSSSEENLASGTLPCVLFSPVWSTVHLNTESSWESLFLRGWNISSSPVVSLETRGDFLCPQLRETLQQKSL